VVITVTYQCKELQFRDHEGGINPLISKIKQEFEELGWVHWKLITKEGDHITRIEQL